MFRFVGGLFWFFVYLGFLDFNLVGVLLVCLACGFFIWVCVFSVCGFYLFEFVSFLFGLWVSVYLVLCLLCLFCGSAGYLSLWFSVYLVLCLLFAWVCVFLVYLVCGF